MSSSMSSFLFHMIVFLIVAWIIYSLDRQFGRVWYRKWYDLSREKPLPAETIRGFICGRPGKTKCYVSVLLSFFVTVFLSTFGQGSTLTWFFTWIFGIIVMLIGFVTGPLVVSIWSKREKVFGTIDKIEAREIDPFQEVRKAGQKVGSWFSPLINRWDEFWYGPKPKQEPPVVSEPSPAPTDKCADKPSVPEQLDSPSVEKKDEELSPQGKIDQFTKGG